MRRSRSIKIAAVIFFFLAIFAALLYFVPWISSFSYSLTANNWQDWGIDHTVNVKITGIEYRYLFKERKAKFIIELEGEAPVELKGSPFETRNEVLHMDAFYFDSLTQKQQIATVRWNKNYTDFTFSFWPYAKRYYIASVDPNADITNIFEYMGRLE